MTFYQGAILSQRIIANALIEARCVIGGSPAFRKVRGLGGNIRNADIHVSHLSSGGTGVLGALVRARKPTVLGCSARKGASRRRFLHSAEPDIHLLPQAPKSRHRRLSLCSLPVPKQFVESLRSVISFAQSATCRIWQSALCSSRFIWKQFYAAPVRRSSPDMKSRCCRSTASRYETIFRATASVARFPLPFCFSLS